MLSFYFAVFLTLIVCCSFEYGSARRIGFLDKNHHFEHQIENSHPQLGSKMYWFPQKLDHFNPSNTATWNQRHMHRDKFQKPGGPAFLMIGSESKMQPRWLKEGQMAKLAEDFGAIMFYLEHRYYGGSRPTSNLAVENMRYLTSEQALADAAYYIQKMNEQFSLNNTKWVVFGGSYGGSLAAWLRFKYPHLVYAAVSSSAPLEAKADFPEYLRTVTKSLATAGHECVEAIKIANEKIDKMVHNSTKRQHLRELFRLCDPLEDNEKDIASFSEILADNFAYIVQYNRNSINFEKDTAVIDINAVCKIMTDKSIECPVHRYAEVNKLISIFFGERCISHKYQDTVDTLKDVNYGSEENMYRQWFYQTCVEFGFYQTSSEKGDTFGDKFPLNFFINMCRDTFGPQFNETFLKRSVEETNVNYGGRSIPIERVLHVHGSIDPWSTLGVTHSPYPGSHAILINGTAHCSNMYPESGDDPLPLIEARKTMKNIMNEWLTKKSHD